MPGDVLDILEGSWQLSNPKASSSILQMSKLRFREVKNNLLEVTLLVSEQVIDLISLPSPVCLQDTLPHLDVHVLNGCSFYFFLFLAVLGLHCCVGSSLVVLLRLLLLQSTGSRTLQLQ